MENNKTIAIYYIATGEYKKFFPGFLESLNNFYSDNKKTVKLISDGLEEYAGYEKENVRVELCPRINNYPWPVITLYKMWHIKENFSGEYDYSCYFNANAVIYPHADDALDLNKVNLSFHSYNYDGMDYDPWPHIHISTKSVAFMQNGTYDYIQGGFFFGPSDMILKMCADVVGMVLIDTVNLHVIAQWHDESYLNKWAVDHSDEVVKKLIMSSRMEDTDSYRFIYLRQKDFLKRF